MSDLRFPELIRDVADFPQPGIVFKDITPVLADPDAFAEAIDSLIASLEGSDAQLIAGIEARGFVLAAPVAAKLGLGFVPVRKQGKLPWSTVQQSYELEYGSATIEAHADAIPRGTKVAVIDDVLATGGTAQATCDLLEGIGGEIVAVSFLIEIGFLKGRSKLTDRPIHTILTL